MGFGGPTLLHILSSLATIAGDPAPTKEKLVSHHHIHEIIVLSDSLRKEHRYSFLNHVVYHIFLIRTNNGDANDQSLELASLTCFRDGIYNMTCKYS